MKLRPPAAIAYGLAVAVIVVDQLVKSWILNGLQLGDGRIVPIFGPLQFSLVRNQGVSFGLFQGSDAGRWILTGFSLVVSIGLAVWALRLDKRLTGLAVGFVIGGALGNMIDRIRYGSVVDFVDVTRTHVFPWVFNVADSAITVGVILLLAESLLAPKTAAT
ncbi:MAG TPA: signal peptidase II [Caulobacteraceae bacterium]